MPAKNLPDCVAVLRMRGRSGLHRQRCIACSRTSLMQRYHAMDWNEATYWSVPANLR
jgi:hypothetical protein